MSASWTCKQKFKFEQSFIKWYCLGAKVVKVQCVVNKIFINSRKFLHNMLQSGHIRNCFEVCATAIPQYDYSSFCFQSLPNQIIGKSSILRYNKLFIETSIAAERALRVRVHKSACQQTISTHYFYVSDQIWIDLRWAVARGAKREVNPIDGARSIVLCFRNWFPYAFLS